MYFCVSRKKEGGFLIRVFFFVLIMYVYQFAQKKTEQNPIFIYELSSIIQCLICNLIDRIKRRIKH